jgi:hypothetical protein
LPEPTTDPADDWLPDVDPSAPQQAPARRLPVVSSSPVASSRESARLWVEVDV